MTLKVLPLEPWMTHRFTYILGNLTPCNPICNRTGFYYNSSVHFCWFEINGTAYQMATVDFTDKLEQLNHKPLRSCERDAIIVLCRAGLATRHQFNLLQMDDRVYELRRTLFEHHKHIKKIRSSTNANCRNNNRSSA